MKEEYYIVMKTNNTERSFIVKKKEFEKIDNILYGDD